MIFKVSEMTAGSWDSAYYVQVSGLTYIWIISSNFQKPEVVRTIITPGFANEETEAQEM